MIPTPDLIALLTNELTERDNAVVSEDAIQARLSELSQSMSQSMDEQRVAFEQQIASLNIQLDQARARVTDYIPPTQYAEILADRDNWQRQYLDLQARIDQAQQQS